MTGDTDSVLISAALAEIQEKSVQATDGKWLELLTVESAPLIAEWDIAECCLWADWSEREYHYERRTDIGIDAVARRASDGKLVAIQCKARKLDDAGHGSSITYEDLATFIGTSSAAIWAERWVVTNGDTRISDNAISAAAEKPLKQVNLESDLLKQQELTSHASIEACPHCTDPEKTQNRECMQREAIDTSVERLEKLAEKYEGRARGRIILPCGTGKTRIALRIVERLTRPGEISAVLCPSIALVAQLRREFLANRRKPLKALAVCSDETAGQDRDLSQDQTADLSRAKASEIKGAVTTSPELIGEWIDEIVKGGGGGGGDWRNFRYLPVQPSHSRGADR